MCMSTIRVASWFMSRGRDSIALVHANMVGMPGVLKLDGRSVPAARVQLTRRAAPAASVPPRDEPVRNPAPECRKIQTVNQPCALTSCQRFKNVRTYIGVGSKGG